MIHGNLTHNGAKTAIAPAHRFGSEAAFHLSAKRALKCRSRRNEETRPGEDQGYRPLGG
jgi:hypothetical protein